MIHHEAFYQHGVTSPLLVQAQNLYFVVLTTLAVCTCTSLLHVLEGYCSLIVLSSECQLGTLKLHCLTSEILPDIPSTFSPQCCLKNL